MTTLAETAFQLAFGDLSFEEENHYTPKHRDDFLRPENQWHGGQQEGETTYVELELAGSSEPGPMRFRQLVEEDAARALLPEGPAA